MNNVELELEFERAGKLSQTIDSGYGNVSHFTHEVWECLDCGALVLNCDAHKEWHSWIVTIR